MLNVNIINISEYIQDKTKRLQKMYKRYKITKKI